MPLQKLRKFLDREHIKYVLISHSPAVTAPEVAASAHIPGREMVKTVMVKVDGKLAMAVLPSTAHVDLEKLRQVTGARELELALEKEFGKLFPNCELGAMPPFGNLWDLDVFVDPSLTRVQDIAFNAGTHTEVLKMKFTDFERLVEPRIGAFAD
jgi:Ala-tRNA(Pro) deacylase